ncbi:hypothetical protein GCM10027160_29070 [Streptomyces calidiresistens]|uniref:Uncharacterized protein n=1 Tax=Streptomyces calidiresistens TaxID=1485586 RepID=A0A7W3T085_9ACTN|nr:hypothetical protein [Streptomyces calidiresistens]MBB0228525.1 hypothetical protein [Streptomyces calidiresistens]
MTTDEDPRSVAAAAASGDRRRALEALRDDLAHRLDAEGTTDRDAAALATQLRLVLSDLAALRGGETGDSVDDLAARRARRRAETAAASGSTVGEQRGPGDD